MMKTVMTLCVLFTVLSAALSFAAGDPSPDTTRVVIRGVDRVVDGWVRTDGTASFSEPTLSGHGRAWSAYDHILMRFDLSSVDAMRFGRVRKAVLRLHVLQAKNPQRKVTQVAPAVTRWNTRATALSPLGDKTGWPQRAGFANIQYTMRKELQTGKVICKPGVVEFEITEVLARWLYHGMPNRGLMVSASPAIFGAPDQGSWSLLCAASEAKESLRPALIIDMEGQVPLPEEAEQRALALYPSAALAPVKDPYYMVYYNAGSRQQWRRLPTINMTTYSGARGLAGTTRRCQFELGGRGADRLAADCEVLYELLHECRQNEYGRFLWPRVELAGRATGLAGGRLSGCRATFSAAVFRLLLPR